MGTALVISSPASRHSWLSGLLGADLLFQRAVGQMLNMPSPCRDHLGDGLAPRGAAAQTVEQDQRVVVVRRSCSRPASPRRAAASIARLTRRPRPGRLGECASPRAATSSSARWEVDLLAGTTTLVRDGRHARRQADFGVTQRLLQRPRRFHHGGAERAVPYRARHGAAQALAAPLKDAEAAQPLWPGADFDVRAQGRIFRSRPNVGAGRHAASTLEGRAATTRRVGARHS